MTRGLQFSIALSRLAADLGEPLDADRAERIGRLLAEELSDEEFAVACRQVLLNESRIPAPAKFIEYGQGSRHARAEAAIAKAFEARKRHGINGGWRAKQNVGPEIWAAIEAMGGWWLFCQDDLNPTAWRAQFLNSYKSREETNKLQESKVLLSAAQPEFQKLVTGLAEQREMPKPPPKPKPKPKLNSQR